MIYLFRELSFCLTFLLITGNGSWASLQETAEQDSSSELELTQEFEDKEQEVTPTIDDTVLDFQEFEGFFTYYWDEDEGKIWLEVDVEQGEFLFSHGIATGLGSNPVGLDRGQLGGQHVVHFRRVGPKVLLIERNLRFRATSDNPLENRAVDESFANSVLWSATVSAKQGNRVLVDATPLLFRDWHNVVGRLKNSDQGSFSLDEKRSAVFLERCKNFPNNSELEVSLTFKGDSPGPLVRQTTPTPEAVSLRSHYSFVRLPDDDYQPRMFDPRTPSMHITFADYSTPIDSPLEKRWIIRHRLKKKDPAAATSEAVEPIVYYVDPGAPQEIQEALIEGASWWNEAFEAIGFRKAFQVKLLPENADPMDVRYNTIQWVHRSTRGWSFGSSVIDPRTGEIIKGHVTLGSLRVRQDRLIFEGLEPRFTSASNACECCGMAGMPGDTRLALLDDKTSAKEVALARIRQLSAHEVGHTLGFVHNFAASTYGDRASVMDYPAPRIKITEGQIDLSDAYGVGIGIWDKFAVEYAYRVFDNDRNEVEQLRQVVEKAITDGLLFMTDADARPASAAHPLANLWDNGQDPVDELKHLLKVRATAMHKFGKYNVPKGTPLSQIEETFVPIYLLHRYQIEAASKLIGGNYYTYAVAGDNQVPTKHVPTSKQLEATRTLLDVLRPENLQVDPKVIQLIAPTRTNSLRSNERFGKSTGPMFDPMAAAETVADMVFRQMLNPQRVARLANTTNYDAKFGPQAYMFYIVDDAWRANDGLDSEDHRQISRVVRWRLNRHLFDLASNSEAAVDVRIAARAAIDRIHQYCKSHARRANRLDRDFANWIKDDIERFWNRPHPTSKPDRTRRPPAGSPIGN